MNNENTAFVHANIPAALAAHPGSDLESVAIQAEIDANPGVKTSQGMAALVGMANSDLAAAQSGAALDVAGPVYPDAMVNTYAGYWRNFDSRTVGVAVPLGGDCGWLVRLSHDEAAYVKAGVAPFIQTPSSDLNEIANKDPAIAAAWLKDFGFVTVPLA
jgi:hypothetical protein